MRNKLLITLSLLVLVCTEASGQEIKARVSGLESNEQYMSMLRKLYGLTQREDSLNAAADRARDLYRRDAAGRREHAAEILNLERAVFDVRDSIGALDLRLGAIEQDWIITNMDSSPVSSPTSAPAEEPLFVSSGKPVANLVYNDFFRTNLAPPDYASLIRAQENERPVETYMKIMLFNQNRLKTLDTMYAAAADEKTADSLFRLAERYDRLNALIADTVAPIWNKAFDTKVYTYNYLLDRFNRSALLDRFEELMVGMRREKSAAAGKYFSDVAAWYPLQKRLLLDYELRLADALGLRNAADSLRAVAGRLDPESFRSPDAMPQKRVFMDLADAVQVRPPKYTSSNPVPQVRIYPEGTIYRILLGNYTRTQPYSLFKFIYPLSYERKADNRYYYYAGGYPDYESASKAAAEMKRLGFSKPTVVAWRDGAYDPRPKPGGDESAPPTAPSSAGKAAAPSARRDAQTVKPGSAVYRVEISGTASLPSGVRDAIKEAAPGKEISRVADPDSGAVVFSVGNFPDEQTAAAVAAAVEAAGNLKTNIVPIGQ